ncbi:MAG: hypothetical protein RLZZ200_1859 [Pseudomonadota bacterium]|jgi:uncharacterized membrane protein YdbT with pleckstrin-like domain
MAGYVDSNLIKNETVIHRGHLSLWSLSGLLLLGVLLLPIVIGLFFLLAALIRYKTTELAVTNKRVIVKTGLISRRTLELNLAKAESIQVEQSLMGRLFDYGSLQVNGTGMSHAPIQGIRAPLEFRRQFMEAQDQAAERYGMPPRNREA